MHRRSAFCLFLSTLLLLAAGNVHAAPRDSAATQKIEEAINKYYLATEFDKAEALLKGILEACEDRCSPNVKARAWMYIGIVRGSGRQDMAGTKDAFQQAVAYDPSVKLDEALSTPAVKQIFDAAGGAGGAAAPEPVAAPKTGGAVAAATGAVPGNMECTPNVKEVEMQRPIPVACTTDEPAAKVSLRYKAFGSEEWSTVPMQKKGEYWQGAVPCTDTGTSGKLRFYVQAKDKDGEELDSFGSKKQPAEIKIVSKTAEDPPSYPGQPAPQKCISASECPEEMIGTPACPTGGAKGRGGKGWGSPCDTSQECDVGLLCQQGDNGRTCENAPKCDANSDCPSGAICKSGSCDISDEGGSSTPGKFKKNMVGLHIGADFAYLSGTDVCASSDFSCFYAGNTPYRGTPQKGYGGTLNGGLSPGTVRIMASYERLFTGNIGAEARVGFAFNGGPKGATGPAFLPLHLEVRGKYWFGRDIFTRKGLRPFVALGGGIAQVDAKLAVTIYDPSIQPVTAQRPQLDAYRKLGQAFIAGGGGAMYAFGVNHGLVLNLNLMVMLGTSGFVLEPSLGYQLSL